MVASNNHLTSVSSISIVNLNKLFALTCWRLASWYAGVIGIILSLCRLGIYEAIAHVHKITLNLELKSVARTLHDRLELTLKQPGQLGTSYQLIFA